jgi:hypothetical protein
MAKVRGQDIPSAMLDAYKSSLRLAVSGLSLGGQYATFKYAAKKYGSTIQYIQRRYPFRQPFKQDSSPHSPTKAQKATREIFDNCRRCFKAQPKTGGATPPDLGPRNREYWYTASGGSGLFYYDYFMKTTMNVWFGTATPAKYPFIPVVPDWCQAVSAGDASAEEYDDDDNNGNSPIAAAGLVFSPEPIQKRRYAFFKFPTVGFAALYFNASVDMLDAPENYNHVVDIYKVLSSWEELTITWNNMPALGTKIGEINIFRTYGTGQTFRWWIAPISQPSEFGVCLVMRKPYEYGEVNFRVKSLQEADPTKRPYAVY